MSDVDVTEKDRRAALEAVAPKGGVRSPLMGPAPALDDLLNRTAIAIATARAEGVREERKRCLAHVLLRRVEAEMDRRMMAVAAVDGLLFPINDDGWPHESWCDAAEDMMPKETT
jgi:hypothetical protein